MEKKFFSLIELMIVLAIISIVGSSFGIWVFKLIEKERFYSDIKNLQKTVLMCHKMAQIRQSDVFFILRKSSKGVKYEIENISLPMEKNLISNSSMESNNKEIKSIKIEFSPSGGVYPGPTLIFLSKNKKYSKEFNFKSQ